MKDKSVHPFVQLVNLAQQWESQAKFYDKRFRKNWNKLRDGKLPQDDDIIYGCYEDAETARTLVGCAKQLRKII